MSRRLRLFYCHRPKRIKSGVHSGRTRVLLWLPSEFPHQKYIFIYNIHSGHVAGVLQQQLMRFHEQILRFPRFVIRYDFIIWLLSGILWIWGSICNRTTTAMEYYILENGKKTRTDRFRSALVRRIFDFVVVVVAVAFFFAMANAQIFLSVRNSFREYQGITL